MTMRQPATRAVGLLVVLVAAVAVRHASEAAMTSPVVVDERPSGILEVPRASKEARHVLVAEKATQSLHVYEFEGDRVRRLAVLPCTTGKAPGDKREEGDLKTPEGAYWFLRRIPGSELPPLYGAGALVMDYPNAFDRLDGKTGSGIWLHGVETNERAKVANDTRGCVAVRNDDFDELRRLVRLHDTPILVVDRIQLRKGADLARDARTVDDLLENWRRSWEARDMDAYMSCYDDAFQSSGMDKRGWERHKRHVASLESDRRVTIDDVGILREKDRLWVTFRQEYASPSHRDVGQKTLYLRERSGRYAIVGESWRTLDEPLRIEAPAAVVASASPRRPQLEVPAPRIAEVPASTEAPAASPEPVQRQPSVGGEGLPIAQIARAEPAPAPAPAPAPEEAPAHEAAPEAAANGAPQVASAQEPTLVIEEERPPSAPAPRVSLAAELEAARVSRGAFRLSEPHARSLGGDVVIAAQLLSATPTMTRTGTLVVSVTTDQGERELVRERYSLRQGRDVEVIVPASSLPALLSVRVMDDSQRVVLDQDVRVATLAASASSL